MSDQQGQLMTAVLRHARISARKVRLVADQIRRRRVGDVMDILNFSNKKAARLMSKLLDSALANATNNHGMEDVNQLRVDLVLVDEGPTLKRLRPRARGRADRTFKRSCHISIGLREHF